MRISDWSSDVCSSDLVADQPCNGEGLAVAQLQCGLCAPRLEAGDRQPVDDDRGRRIDRADFGRDDQVDEAVLKHRRREAQADAEGLELDCDRAAEPAATTTPAAAVLRHRDRSEEHTSELQSLMRISYAG